MLARDILHVTFLHLQARWLDDVPGLRDKVAAIIREALIEERE
jgi:hypothetical protein